MIIGNGLLAKTFKQYERDNIIVFASGVSNSLETKISEFSRERSLLLDVLKNNTNDIVYFGTCSLYDSSLENSPYVNHKIAMESLIKKYRKNYYILRLSQVVGKSNNKTFINYIYTEIMGDRPLNVWGNASRNIISTDLILRVSKEIISNKAYGIYNIAYFEAEKVSEIVRLMGEILGKDVKVNLLDKGGEYNIPLGKVEGILESIGVTKDKKKYYTNLLQEFLK